MPSIAENLTHKLADQNIEMIRTLARPRLLPLDAKAQQRAFNAGRALARYARLYRQLNHIRRGTSC